MRAPFPYFGGKSKIAAEVWARFGDVPNYVEPFFGSGAVLLSRPGWRPDVSWIETANDKDGMVSNFWRALQHDPEQLVRWADWPVNENDLHARHAWLVARRDDMTRKLEGDPDYYDVKVAGWWVWGMCIWIGRGFCSGVGPWRVAGGELVLVKTEQDAVGIQRRRVHLGNAGMGIQRQRVHLGDRGIEAWINALAARMSRVRVCSGDWRRVVGPTPTTKLGLTGVFLDPPYSHEAERDENIYRVEDLEVAHDARRWALSHGDNPLMRIALCGYKGEHDELGDAGWVAVKWETNGGYAKSSNGRGRANAKREVVWFSPHCLRPSKNPHTLSLFPSEHQDD